MMPCLGIWLADSFLIQVLLVLDYGIDYNASARWQQGDDTEIRIVIAIDFGMRYSSLPC